jgi:hypothetical protein
VVTLTLRGGHALSGALANAPRIVSDAERAAMGRAVLLVEAEARRRVVHDTRALMGSISSRVEQRGRSLVGRVGPSVRYGAYVEVGTRPHWPPAAPLRGWARRHGLSVYVVQRAIARRGTRRRPFLVPALERNAARIVRLFADAGEVVSATIARSTRAGSGGGGAANG